MAWLKAPEGHGSFVWGGDGIQRQIVDGLVEVPDQAVPELLQTGYVIAAPPEPEPQPEPLAIAPQETQARRGRKK